MSINNLDYVWITLFFSITGICAYLFRNKNKTGNDFLFAKTKIDNITLYVGGFGILEIVLANLSASKIGFSTWYITLIVGFIVVLLLANILKKRYQMSSVSNFNAYLYKQLGPQTANVTASMSVLLFLGLAIIAECITFKLLHALLGWNFVNSIIGVMGLVLIYLIIGGVASFRYNSLVQASIIILTILLVAAFVVFELDGIATLTSNLSNLALLNNHVADFYTMPHLMGNDTLNGFILFLIGFGGLYVINYSLENNDSSMSKSLSTRAYGSFFTIILLAAVLILPGVFAISTKMPHKTLNGKEIVTIQAQLADGQTGYIVKAIDSNSPQINKEPGLIPPLIDTKTGITIKNSYDYDLASVVTFRQYLPKELEFLLVLLVLAGFMLSFANYILQASRIILENIIIPNKIFEKYGDKREIWVIRVSLVAIAILVTGVAEFYAPYFVFTQGLYILSAVLLAPLFAAIMLSIICCDMGKSYLAVLGGSLVAIGLIFVINSPDQLYKYTLIAVIGFFITFISGLLLKSTKNSGNE